MIEPKKPEFDTDKFKTISSWVLYFNKHNRRTIGQSWAFTIAKRLNIGIVDKVSGFRYLTEGEFKGLTDYVFNREKSGPMRLVAEFGLSRQYIYKRLEETGIGIKNFYSEDEKNQIRAGRSGLSGIDLEA